MKRIVLITYLYGLQGLPYGLQTNFLPLVLKKDGYNLWNISFIHVLSLPWLLKGILATQLNNCVSQRKHWISCSLMLLSVSFTTIGFSFNNIYVLTILLFINSLLAVIMDIAVDATAIAFVKQENVGLYNSVQVVAYKVGVLLISVLSAATADISTTFISFLYIFGAVATKFCITEEKICYKSISQSKLLSDNGIETRKEKSSVSQAMRKNQNSFFAHFNILCSLFSSNFSTWVGYHTKILVLLCLFYKVGEKGFTSIFPLCMLDQGMDIQTISLVNSIGQGCSLFGSIVGGLYFKSFRLVKLVIIVCCLCMTMHIIALLTTNVNSFIYCGVDGLLNVCSGFITTWTFSQMMNSSKNVPENYQAMHYSLLSTMELFGKLFFLSFAGLLADAVGYTVFFSSCCFIQLSLIYVIHCLE
uniref:Major facilitator superfamily domain-containing protein 3 n=1 Tax=Hydra vulgaris TaxID=6087 RepID=T2M788_HYDVU